MTRSRLIFVLAAGVLALTPTLACAQEDNLVVPPSLRAPAADSEAKPAQPGGTAKKPMAHKVVGKVQGPNALPLSSPQKIDENPVSVGMKWKAESGSGGSAAAGNYNPWFYKDSSSSSQVRGGLTFGF